MNELIKKIFTDFEVGEVFIPVTFLRYDGKSTTYITYRQTDIDSTLSGDDKLLNYVDFYDFDIYSKGNYFPIIESVKNKLKQNGFSWQPGRSSGDMYEDDTGYFHKTLCFSIERYEGGNN